MQFVFKSIQSNSKKFYARPYMRMRDSDNDDLELITPHVLINTWQELGYCLDICRATTGAHIEV